MNDDLGMAGLRSSGENPRGIVRIIASNSTGVIHVWDVGYDCKLGYRALAIAPWLSELASRDALAPIGGPEVVKVALRYGHVVVVILQLDLAMLVK